MSRDSPDAPGEHEAAAGAEEEEESEWRFSLEDVSEEGIVEQEREPIEPETPNLENVVFVLLGVVLAIVVLLQGIGFI